MTCFRVRLAEAKVSDFAETPTGPGTSEPCALRTPSHPTTNFWENFRSLKSGSSRMGGSRESQGFVDQSLFDEPIAPTWDFAPRSRSSSSGFVHRSLAFPEQPPNTVRAAWGTPSLACTPFDGRRLVSHGRRSRSRAWHRRRLTQPAMQIRDSCKLFGGGRSGRIEDDDPFR